jgi:hypothetical protein
MGQAKRKREELERKRRNRKIIAEKTLKALVTLLCMPIILLIVIAWGPWYTFRENVWWWK